MARRKPTAAQLAQLDVLRTLLNEGRVTELPLHMVEPDPGQPRRTFTDASLQDLATDIATNGVLQPITVDHTEKGWQIVMGERRWRAAMQGGLKTIPAILVPPTVPDSEDASRWQLDRRLRQFAENHHREPLPPMDLAYFLRSLRDELGLSATQIAASLKDRGVREMGRSYVSNTIRLTELPKGYQQQIADGDLAPSHGKYILMLGALGEAGYDTFDERLAIERETLEDGERVTTAEVQLAIGAAFYRHGHRLDEGVAVNPDVMNALDAEGLPYTPDIVFDRAQCKSCPKRQAFTTHTGQQQIWCLDREAFLEKQRAALKAIAAGEAPVPEGVEVDLTPLEERESAGSGELPGLDDRSNQGAPDHVTPEQRERDLRRKVHDHLVEWLRERIIEVFADEDLDRSIAFVLWAALGFPRVAMRWDDVPMVHGEQPWRMKFDVMGLADAMEVCDPTFAGELSGRQTGERVRNYVNAAVRAMDPPSVWRWAVALGRDHLDGYDLASGYFDCCDKAEVEILAKLLGVDVAKSATKGAMVSAILAKGSDYVPARVELMMEEGRTAHRAAIDAWTKAKPDGLSVSEQAAA